MNYRVALVASSFVLALRQLVLRPGRPLSSAVFAGDDAADTVHLAGYVGDQIMGVASLYKVNLPESHDNASWQLRGMATHPQMQGQGVGKALVQACVEYVSSQQGIHIWCNARTSAEGFYLRLGFMTLSAAPFDIAGVGPHVIMKRDLSTDR